MDYLEFFNEILDMTKINGIFLFSPIHLTVENKLNILEEISYRAQIELNKTVYGIFSNPFEAVNSELETITNDTPVNENLNLYNNKNNLFLANIRFPYFKNDPSWEEKLIELFSYYRLPVLGFTTREQCIKIYEK